MKCEFFAMVRSRLNSFEAHTPEYFYIMFDIFFSPDSLSFIEFYDNLDLVEIKKWLQHLGYETYEIIKLSQENGQKVSEFVHWRELLNIFYSNIQTAPQID